MLAIQSAPSHALSEVVFERSPCFGACPVYKVTLRSDGSATYEGIRFVDRIGKFDGHFNDDQLSKLGAIADKLGFWNLKPEYTIGITDQPSQDLTLVSGKETKKVHEYGHTAPAELWALYTMVDGIVAGIKDWKKAE